MLNMMKTLRYFPQLASGGRREDRHPTAATITLSCPDLGMFDGVLIDLSAHGARLRTLARVVVDAAILLEIEAMPMLSGRVIWVEGQEMGMCFDHRLHAVVLDHLLIRSGALRA